jgi:hypothetical protein
MALTILPGWQWPSVKSAADCQALNEKIISNNSSAYNISDCVCMTLYIIQWADAGMGDGIKDERRKIWTQMSRPIYGAGAIAPTTTGPFTGGFERRWFKFAAAGRWQPFESGVKRGLCAHCG